MALYLLAHHRQSGVDLAHALMDAMHGVLQCTVCYGFSDDPVCPLCLDSTRDDKTLCVVEQASDVLAIESSGGYRGRYFVLGGHLSPIDGIGTQHLRIDALMQRLKQNPMDELILATGATSEGQTTAFFIQDIAKTYVTKITRLAQGIPMGGELGYIDAITLGQALTHRTRFE